MSRYTGPKCKLCRREGVKLFLKGEKCEGPKCPLLVRQVPPGGLHKRRSKTSDFKVQLREKQKVKRLYIIGERQFKNYYLVSRKSSLNTGEELLSHLERRLDNVVYRLGLSASRAQARQKIRHGHFRIADRLVNMPAYEVELGDVIKFKKEPLEGKIAPTWLDLSAKKKEAKVLSLPNRSQVTEDINEQLIIEFYSR